MAMENCYKATVFSAKELKCAMHPKMKANQELPLIFYVERTRLVFSGIIVYDSCNESSATLVKSSGYSIGLGTNDVEMVVANAMKSGGAVIEGKIVEAEILFYHLVGEQMRCSTKFHSHNAYEFSARQWFWKSGVTTEQVVFEP
ncbi:hypothetical protein IFM89_014686 [Coptis chinensis]|uniref:Glyoxalase At5g48480-like N-terminal domain-containing protein n=1 Tax=Coptis chinensis TaxID=261450 RepID=A0A835HEU2_9MAGN|nr:hypothetical protein IFM89_014686 [Coptis chinensis]